MQIKNALDELLHSERYDVDFLKRIVIVQEGFISKNSDHALFFGGTLTGVYTVRQTETDRDHFLDYVLGTERSILEQVLYSLKETGPDGKSVPVVNLEHKRYSDVFNIVCTYLIHKCHTSQHLTEAQRHQAKTRICAYLIYKFLTSLMYHYYQYPADPMVAQATYEALSLKFSLKEHGSWAKTLWVLAEKMSGEHSVHKRCIEKMDVDYDVEKFINDVQSRVKDMMKNIYRVFIKVHESKTAAVKVGNLVEIDGEVEIRDTTTAMATYGRYIKQVIPDAGSFIQLDLLQVVLDLMNTANPRVVHQTLTWISQNYLTSSGKLAEGAVEDLIEHAISYLVDNRDISHRDIAKILLRLKGTYMSSRNTEVKLLAIRKNFEKITSTASGITNTNTLSAAKTAVMLYIVARAFARRHYTSN